jgi:KRAB domain-containing zinc finger protein
LENKTNEIANIKRELQRLEVTNQELLQKNQELEMNKNNFANNHSLERSHGNKPFSCNFCDQCFVQVDEVKEHIKIHNSLLEVEDLKNQVISLQTQVEELEVKLNISQKKEFKKKGKVEDKQEISESGVDQEVVKDILEQRKVMNQSKEKNNNNKNESENKKRKFTCGAKTVKLSKKDHLRVDNETLHEGKKAFKCNDCNKPFLKKSHLTRHEKTHLNRNLVSQDSKRKTYACKTCEKVFGRIEHLKDHTKTVHKRKKPYKCNECTKEFSKKNGLTIHMQSIHNENDPFSCKFCESLFKNRESLATHYSTIHSEEPMRQCKLCKGSQFFSVSNFQSHVTRLHSEDKPKSTTPKTCPICYAEFEPTWLS